MQLSQIAAQVHEVTLHLLSFSRMLYHYRLRIKSAQCRGPVRITRYQLPDHDIMAQQSFGMQPVSQRELDEAVREIFTPFHSLYVV